MSFAEASACLGSDLKHVTIAEHNPAADKRALVALARYCDRFSPVVQLEPGDQPCGLFLDVSGCSIAFKGEENLAQQVAKGLRRIGYEAKIAIADTIAAACAAACYASLTPLTPARSCTPNSKTRRARPAKDLLSGWIVIPAGETIKALSPLPIASLRFPAEVQASFAKLGIKMVSDLLRLAPSEIATAFGHETLNHFEKAIGKRSDPLIAIPPSQMISASWDFETGIDRKDIIEDVMCRLIDQIVERLQGQWGLQRMLCSLHLDSKVNTTFEVLVHRPTNSAAQLKRLIKLRLEPLGIPRPVVRLAIQAAKTQCSEDDAPQLFGNTEDRKIAKDWSDLVERLSNRLGPPSVSVVSLVHDPDPCCAFTLEPAVHLLRNTQLKDEMREHNPPPSDSRTRATPIPQGEVRDIYSLPLRKPSATEEEPASAPAIDAKTPGSLKKQNSKRKKRESETPSPARRRDRELVFRLRPLRVLSVPRLVQVLSIAPEGYPAVFRARLENAGSTSRARNAVQTQQQNESHFGLTDLMNEQNGLRNREPLAADHHVVARYSGPERIETGWWRNKPISRDYYRVETQAGHRYWIFRCRQTNQWYLHGFFN